MNQHPFYIVELRDAHDPLNWRIFSGPHETMEEATKSLYAQRRTHPSSIYQIRVVDQPRQGLPYEEEAA